MVVLKATDPRSKQIKDTFRHDTRILGEVKRHLLQRVTDDQANRDTAHIHPSEVCKSDWCPRQTYFRITEEPVTDPQPGISFQLENIFDEGHDIHDKWQRRLWEMGVLAGMWECLVCHHRWWDVSPSRCPDPWCGLSTLRYREVPIVNEEYHLLGHADGLLSDSRAPALIEVKSIGLGTLRMEAPRLHREHTEGKSLEKVWSEIRRPFAPHLRQGMLYCFATGVPEIVFLYEFKSNQQVKEFVVKYQPQLIEWILERCEQLKAGLKSGFPPVRPDFATNPDVKACKACPYRTACWGEGESRAIAPAAKVQPRAVAGGAVLSGDVRRIKRTPSGA